MASAARSICLPAAPAPSKVTKPRATLAPVKKVRNNTSAKIIRAVNANYKHGWYPWDDFQDEIIVDSVETLHLGRRKPLAGVEHYLQQLSQQKEEYKHICSHPDEYRKLPKDLSDPEDEDDIDSDSGSETDSDIDYTEAARPPHTADTYDQPIYEANVSNPAVFLAIIRIAQKNYPFLDFVSALGHLPNLPVNAPLPKLEQATFPEDIPYDPKPTDASLQLIFLPTFFADGRHAIGFYEIADDDDTKITTCLFTPCTTADFVKYHLVLSSKGRNDREVLNMKHVGGRGGGWLHPDVVEEYEDWKFCVRVVSKMWQGRLKLYLGAEES